MELLVGVLIGVPIGFLVAVIFIVELLSEKK